MTCIVGLIDNGVLYMGGDSLGSNGITKRIYKNPKVYFANNSNDIIIGSTSSYRQLQILKYENLFDDADILKNKEIDHRYMVTKFIDGLQKLFEKKGIEENEKGVKNGGFFLIGHSKALYKVQSDYSVMETKEGYDAVGSGEEVALGSLCSTVGEEPIERIKKALIAAEKHACGVQRPFVILNTDTKQAEIIE